MDVSWVFSTITTQTIIDNVNLHTSYIIINYTSFDLFLVRLATKNRRPNLKTAKYRRPTKTTTTTIPLPATATKCHSYKTFSPSHQKNIRLLVQHSLV